MKIFHLNCGTLRAARQGKNPLVTHCLLLAFETHLVLIDSGFGTKDADKTSSRIPLGFRLFVRPALALAETAFVQIKGLGFDPAMVKHIFLTHLDLDHTGGLADFPQATVHVISAELDQALAPQTLSEKRRYQPQHFAHGVNWQRHTFSRKTWAGIPCTETIADLGTKIFFVSLPGHTRNHAGVVVAKSDDHYLMHAGDAYFCRGEFNEPPRCPWGLQFFQRVLALNQKAWKESRLHLARLKKNSNITFFCSHDPGELKI